MSEREIMELILQKVTGVEDRMEGLEKNVLEVKEDVAVLKGDVGVLKGDVGVLKGKIDILEHSVAETKNGVKFVQMTLENVTNRNIGVIADGHITLQRQLEEAIRATRNTEMYQIRVNVMESELKEWKTRLQEHIDKAI